MDNNNQFDTNDNNSNSNSDVSGNNTQQNYQDQNQNNTQQNYQDQNKNNNQQNYQNQNNSQQGGYENSNAGAYYGQNQNNQPNQNQGQFYGGPYDMHNNGYNPQQNAPQRPYSTGFGITSLILGIASIVLFWSGLNIVAGILAIIFGAIQIGKNKQFVNTSNGASIGGIIFGIIGIFLSVIFYTVLVMGIFRSGLAGIIKNEIKDNGGYEYKYKFNNGDDPFNFDDYNIEIPDKD